MNRWPWAVAALLGLWFSTACYTYRPIMGTPPVGSDVRVTVTDEEALRLREQTGELAHNLDGRFTGISGDTLFLSVATYRTEATSGSRQMRRALAISQDGLEGLASRRLSYLRTGIVGALAGTGMLLVMREVVVGGTNTDDGDGGNPTGTLIPIIRIPVGR